MNKTAKRNWIIALALAVCLTITLLIAACAPKNNVSASADGFAALDINPSIELVIADGKVVSWRAANDDAGVLLSGVDLTGMEVGKAAELIASLAEQMGYLNENNKTVRVLVEAESAQTETEIKTDIETGVQNGSGIAEVTEDDYSRRVEELKSQDPALYADLTPAKLRLIETAMLFNRRLTVEQGAKMRTKDLVELVEDGFDDAEDLITDELKDSFEQRYEAAEREIETRIAAVYGEEYGTRYGQYAELDALLERWEDEAERLSLSEADLAEILSLLGLDSEDSLKVNGKVTADSVEEVLDRMENRYDDTADEAWFEEIEERVERILDRYDVDEDELLLSAEQQAELTALGVEGSGFRTLEDVEDYADRLEDRLEDDMERIRLTEQQRSAIRELQQEKLALKQQIMEEMAAEIQNALHEAAEQKAQRLGKGA